MEQLIINRYPRGFTRVVATNTALSPTQSDEVVIVPADNDVQNLYHIHEAKTVNADNWDFQSPVVALAAKLFGDFREWLRLQLVSNDAVYGLNVRFLKDTVKYIREGRRDTAIHSWHELLLEHPDEQPGCASMTRFLSFNLDDPKEFDDFISRWCSYDDGFEDMLCTMHVLFGASKSPLRVPTRKP